MGKATCKLQCRKKTKFSSLPKLNVKAAFCEVYFVFFFASMLMYSFAEAFVVAMGGALSCGRGSRLVPLRALFSFDVVLLGP